MQSLVLKLSQLKFAKFKGFLECEVKLEVKLGEDRPHRSYAVKVGRNRTSEASFYSCKGSPIS